MDITPPFAVSTYTAGFVPGGPLENQLRNRIDGSTLKGTFDNMGIALVDLTNVSENPPPDRSFSVPFAANALLEKEFAVGSLSKIAPMFACYYLRWRVKMAASNIGTTVTTIDDVVAKITKEWTPIVSKRVGQAARRLPQLKKIFNFAPHGSPWPPTIRNGHKTLEQLEGFHEQPQPRN